MVVTLGILPLLVGTAFISGTLNLCYITTLQEIVPKSL